MQVTPDKIEDLANTSAGGIVSPDRSYHLGDVIGLGSCCEYAAFRLRSTGKTRYEAIYEARSEARGEATDDLSIMFLLRLYMTRLVLHFLGSKLSSASINHMTNTWVLRATDRTSQGTYSHASSDDQPVFYVSPNTTTGYAFEFDHWWEN